MKTLLIRRIKKILKVVFFTRLHDGYIVFEY